MKPVPAIFSAGFRVFFLAAGVYAVAAMLVWLLWLAGVDHLPMASAPHLWHAHEMIWGYAGAVIAGFFLTAVPNWTGVPPAGARFVALAAALWLAGRGAMWFSGSLPALAVAVVDLAFLPIIAIQVLGQLRSKPKPQNLMMVALLALLWIGDLLLQVEWMGLGAAGETGIRAGLLTLAAMICVIGGRVTPAFTRNAMAAAGAKSAEPTSHRPLEITTVVAAMALPLLLLFGAPAALSGAAALLAGTGQALRLAGWRGSWTLGKPILWSLHLAGIMLAVGYIALGLAEFGIMGELVALHLIGIGAVGGMTLAVMSRAVLGHTGRPLIAPQPIAIAYCLVASAAILRAVGTGLEASAYLGMVIASGLLWSLAFALFVISIWHPVTEPAPGHVR